MSLRIYHRRHPRLDPRQKPPLGARLDPEHPLSRGLVCRWLLNEGVGNRAGSVGPNKISGRIINPLWCSGGLGFDGVSTHCVAQGAGGALVGDHTVHMRLRFEAAEGDTRYRCLLANRYDNLHGTIIFTYGPSRAIAWDTTSGIDQYRWITGYIPPNKQEVVTTFRCKMGTGRSLYVNGQFYARTSSIPANPEPGLPDAFIGFDPNPSYDGYYFSGTMWDVAIWRWALSDDEIAWLYAEPYAGLLPPTSRRIYSYSHRPRVPRVHHVRRPRLDPRQKPPLGAKVDWAHPLNKGLQCCLLFNEGAGRPADIARPGLARNRYPIMWKPRDRGVSISDNILYLDHQIKYPVREVTIVIRVFYHTPNTLDNRSMVLKYSGTANGNYRLILHAGDYEGYVNLYANAGGVWRALTPLPGSGAPRLTIGAWNDVVATYSPKTGGKIYINGRLVPSSVAGPKGELYQNAIDPIGIGGGSTSCYDSDFLAIYDRELSSDEIAWLYAEPYAGLLPPTSRIYSYSRRGIIRARAIDGAPFGGSIIR